MSKLKKLFLLVLLIIYIIMAYLLKDDQKLLIFITVLFAIIASIFITLNISKRK